MVKPSTKKNAQRAESYCLILPKSVPRRVKSWQSVREGSWTAARAPMDVKVGDKVIFASTAELK